MEQLRPSVTVGICNRDSRAALAWLEAAFGFETRLVIEGPDGGVAHSEMKLGYEWDERHRSPASLGGVNTQSAHVNLDEDIDAHCARARAAGATIFREPEDQFYGERLYGAYDLEGHQWTSSRLLKALSVEEMSQAGGVVAREHL
jgi:uncharacterized glyoxalase superfamily protein PhnB